MWLEIGQCVIVSSVPVAVQVMGLAKRSFPLMLVETEAEKE